MDLALHIAHLAVFWMLIAYDKDKALPAIPLVASAGLYIILTAFVWDSEWTYGIYLTKMIVDGAIALILLQIHTHFSRAQSFLIWLSAGLNLIALMEWFTPSLIIYNAYGTIADSINVLQLFVLLPWVENVVYGVFRHCGGFYRLCNSMDLHMGMFEEYRK